MSNTEQYIGEGKSRPGGITVILLVVIVLFLTFLALVVLFDIPFIETPLREWLDRIAPEGAPVWRFIGGDSEGQISTDDIILPGIIKEPAKDVFEGVIDTAPNKDVLDDIAGGITDEIIDFTDGGPVTGVLIEDDDPVDTIDVHITQEKTPDIDDIQEFDMDMGNRIMSDEAMFASYGPDAASRMANTDILPGRITGIFSGNTLDINRDIHVILVGIPHDTDGMLNTSAILVKTCPIGSQVLYDIDDFKSPSAELRLYAKVWCFGGDNSLTGPSINELILDELDSGSIDYSCIGSEFAQEQWMIRHNCLS